MPCEAKSYSSLRFTMRSSFDSAFLLSIDLLDRRGRAFEINIRPAADLQPVYSPQVLLK